VKGEVGGKTKKLGLHWGWERKQFGGGEGGVGRSDSFRKKNGEIKMKKGAKRTKLRTTKQGGF